MILIQADQRMFEICQDILKLKYINPINQDSEKSKFFSSKNYNPKFKFTLKHPKLNQYKKELSEIIDTLDDQEEMLFIKKAKKLILWINILESVGKQEFTQNCLMYYGKPSPKLVKKAKKLIKLKSVEEKRTISSEEMAKILDKEIKKFPEWKAVEKENLGSRIDDVTMEKTLYIKKGEEFSEQDIKRLIVHEIGVHTKRSYNGSKQTYKIFEYGTANYEQIEEGLAVHTEEKNNLLKDSTMKNYAGRVLAINHALKHSFKETFNFLLNFFNEKDAYHLTLRAKRGIKNTKEQGAFTKDLIYLQGYFNLKEHLENNSQDLDILMKGRIGLKDLKDSTKFLTT